MNDIKYYYSNSTRGFYLDKLHGEKMPKDVVEITFEQYQQFLLDIGQGKQIIINSKEDIIIEDAELSKPSAEEINKKNKMMRLMAYKEESDSLFFKYQRGEIKKKVWLDKVKEIREKFPLIDEEQPTIIQNEEQNDSE